MASLILQLLWQELWVLPSHGGSCLETCLPYPKVMTPPPVVLQLPGRMGEGANRGSRGSFLTL